MENTKDIEIVAAGHTCLDLIPAFTIEGKVDKMTDVLVPGNIPSPTGSLTHSFFVSPIFISIP